MSLERYIQLLQQLLTMTDPANEEEVLCAKNVLKNLLELARESRKADRVVLRSMETGYDIFSNLLRRRMDFAGEPGDVIGNQKKRQRLAMMVMPGC